MRFSRLVRRSGTRVERRRTRRRDCAYFGAAGPLRDRLAPRIPRLSAPRATSSTTRAGRATGSGSTSRSRRSPATSISSRAFDPAAVEAGREESVLRRHPWLFSGAVASRDGDGSDGMAEVVSADGRPLARGAYSPGSQILARLWTFDGRPSTSGSFGSASPRRSRTAGDRAPARHDRLSRRQFGRRSLSRRAARCVRGYGGSRAPDGGNGEVARRARGRGAGGLRSEAPHRARERREAGLGGEGPPHPGPLPAGERERIAGEREKSSRRFSRTAFVSSPTSRAARRPASTSTSGRTGRDCARWRAAGPFSTSSPTRAASRSPRSRAGRRAPWTSTPPGRARARARASAGERPSRSARGLRAGGRLRGSAAPRRGGGVLGRRRLRPSGLREEERGRRSRRARLQGHQPARDEARRSGRLAPDLLLLGPGVRGSLPEDRLLGLVEAGRTFSIAARQGAGPDHPVSLDCPEGEYLKGLWLAARS